MGWAVERLVNKIAGFSLIELMVVIAIVAILAAVAVPAYKNFSLRAKIATNFQLIERFASEAMLQYQKNGSFPNSIDVNGTTVLNAGWAVITLDNVKCLAYEARDASTGWSSPTVMINISIAELDGIPGYVEPTSVLGACQQGSGSTARASIMAMAFRENDQGVIQAVCGQYANDMHAIPIEYLPTSCQCAAVGTFASTGTGC